MNQAKQPSGSVRCFSDYRTAQLKKMKDDMKLSASEEQLRLCQEYYGALKRDPTIEELRFLDSVAAIPPQGDGVMLAELYTNHSYVADTYADMMNKRGELSPDADHPISLTEALDLATAYLERSGKDRKLPNAAPVFRSAEELGNDSVGANGSDLSLSLNPLSRDAKLREGDVFMLIHRGKTPTWKYPDSVGAFLADGEILEATKGSFPVLSGGLLPTLLPLCNGILFDLRAIAPDGATPSHAQLTGKFSEYRILALKKGHSAEVAKLARANGFRPVVFAAVLEEPRVGLLYSPNETIFFETDFLRKLTAKSYAIAKLPNETDAPCDTVQNSIVTRENNPYLMNQQRAQRAVTKHGACCSAVYGVLSSNPFRWALQCALTAVLSTAAAGCPCSESRLAVSIHHPPLKSNPNRVGETVSAILGIYRLQCELGIPAAATQSVEDPDLTSPAVNVFSVSPAPTLPSEFAKRGTRLYCVSPALDADGLPDFNALRALLRELSEFCRQGDLRSVRILANQRLTDAMVQMETDTLTFHLTDHKALVGDALPLAILLESSALLPYPLVGYVKDRADGVSDEPADDVFPTFEETLNRGEAYEVLILSKQKDLGAVRLAQKFREAGALCLRLGESATESQIARAMLTAQAVILCGSVKIPTGKQIAFARRVLCAAGGTVLQLGINELLPQNFVDHHFPNGLSNTIFARLGNKNG